MDMRRLIAKKRDGFEFSEEEIKFIIENYIKDKIPDYQISALLMAIYFQGMEKQELTHFTNYMMHSGLVIDSKVYEGLTADKHSTGGIGDKVSIVLAPLIASCGLKVPMLSGRGLGHTGGTLDKLDSIPGYQTKLPIKKFIEIVKKVGVSIAGQTEEFVPADRKLYALRDVTATVESIPLIASSIMSKKLAAGPQILILDVKTGSGAFMKKYEQAKNLAQTMINIGLGMNRKVKALITDMNQPLGYNVGNMLEILECIDFLKTKKPDDLKKLVFNLSAHILLMANITDNIDSAFKILEEKIDSGKAYEKFIEMVEAHGGDISFIEKPDKFQKAKHQYIYRSPKKGYISYMDGTLIGYSVVELGGGRKLITDNIDYSVGLIFHKKLGDFVNENEPILTIYYNSNLDQALNLIQQSIKISPNKIEKPPLIYEVIS